MSSVYVREQGAVLGRRGGRLVVSRDKAVLGDMPLEQVEQIVLVGNIQLTTPLISHCLRAGIDVCFLSTVGYYLGRLASPQAKDGRLRLEQYRLCVDPLLSLEPARRIAEGKIHNQAVFWQRRFASGAAIVAALRRLREQAGSAHDKESLRGIEGAAAAAHFRMLAQSLPPELGFVGQRERPALDPVNSLLNLGYTLLYKSMFTAIEIVGLDSYVGVLHEPRHGHAALASDLIEEFRAAIVDSLVALLFNRRELTMEDFEQQPGGEVRLTERALPQFLARYEERMETRVRCARANAQFSYRQMLERQARQFARLLRGEQEEYAPYRWDY